MFSTAVAVAAPSLNRRSGLATLSGGRPGQQWRQLAVSYSS